MCDAVDDRDVEVTWEEVIEEMAKVSLDELDIL